MGHVKANQLLELLDHCILPKHRIEASGQELTLSEKDAASSCPEIIIRKRGPVRAYTFEPGNKVMPYFNNQISGLTRMCDAILVYPDAFDNHRKVFVFLVELKSGPVKTVKTKALEQLQSGLLFARFLVEKMELVSGQSFAVEYRGLICTPKTTKRILTRGPKTRASYQKNGALKWIGHNADYPLHLQYYCC